MKRTRLFKAVESWELDVVYETLSDLLFSEFRKGFRIQRDQNPLCVLIGSPNRYIHVDSVLEKLEWPGEHTLTMSLLDLLEGWGGKEGPNYHKLGGDLFRLCESWR